MTDRVTIELEDVGAVTIVRPGSRAICWDLQTAISDGASARLAGALCGLMIRRGWPDGTAPRLRGSDLLSYGAKCYDALVAAGWPEDAIWQCAAKAGEIVIGLERPASAVEVEQAKDF